METQHQITGRQAASLARQVVDARGEGGVIEAVRVAVWGGGRAGGAVHGARTDHTYLLWASLGGRRRMNRMIISRMPYVQDYNTTTHELFQHVGRLS